jgi:hypothetical protein
MSLSTYSIPSLYLKLGWFFVNYLTRLMIDISCSLIFLSFSWMIRDIWSRLIFKDWFFICIKIKLPTFLQEY